MQRDIKNLFNKEESVFLNLDNATHQVKLSLEQLGKLSQNYTLGVTNEKATWYKSVFEYYRDSLIPAIKETGKMEMEHLKIFDKNPDTAFQPQLEIQNHQALARQLFDRLDQLHHEFNDFAQGVKKNNNNSK